MNFNKKIKQKTDFIVTVAIVVGILIVVNFFSYNLFFRWDLTQNKDYSISLVSKQTVGELDDLVNIKVYFSKNVPSQYISLSQEVGDILDSYANYADGRVRVEFIDPGEDEDVKRELMMLGIPQLQFNVLEKDKFQVVNGYLGMAVQYGDRTEAIPIIQSSKDLEYQITLAVKKVTGQIDSVVGLVSSNSTLDINSEISAAYRKLQELYQVREVDLSISEEVPIDINTLVIIGAKEQFSEGQLKAIDAFLMRGGALLVLADGVEVKEGMSAVRNDTGLGGLLENYGLKLNHNLVLDASAGMASFNQGFITFSIPYPFWPKIVKDGFDSDSAAVSGLEGIVLSWASSLDVAEGMVDPDTQVSYLVKTTEKAWSQDDNFNLNPQQPFFPPGETKQYNLAVSISGPMNSAYGNGSIDQGRLIVVADSGFIEDRFLRGNAGNLVFFQNLVDSLSLDDDLIKIRSKGIEARPIKELSDGARAAVRYLNIFGVTAAVVLFGMIRYFFRRKSRFIDEL